MSTGCRTVTLEVIDLADVELRRLYTELTELRAGAERPDDQEDVLI